MNKNYITAAIIACFSFGLSFFIYQKQWIVFLLPFNTTHYKPEIFEQKINRKEVSLFFWKHNEWQTESTTLIWSSDVARNTKLLVNTLLILLEDEQIVNKDIQVVSAAISNKEIFLSLNKHLFHQSDATYTKLMIIESILKTIRHNKVPIQSIRFLIHHEPIHDDHFNFEISWPISGFLEN